MPEQAPPDLPPVKSLEWAVYARDHARLTVHEWALGTLYATYGRGQDIRLSDVGAADKLHVKRGTVADARKGLLSKGLLEDLGPNPRQPKQHFYRLTLPARVVPETGNQLTEVVPETGRGLVPKRATVGPQTGNGLVPKRAQHQAVDQEEIDRSSSRLSDDDVSGPDQDQDQAEDDGQGPGTPDDSSSAEGDDWEDYTPESFVDDLNGVIANEWEGVPRFEARFLGRHRARILASVVETVNRHQITPTVLIVGIFIGSKYLGVGPADFDSDRVTNPAAVVRDVLVGDPDQIIAYGERGRKAIDEFNRRAAERAAQTARDAA